jgi:hypothetical protein
VGQVLLVFPFFIHDSSFILSAAVVRGGEERVELERVLATRTGGQQARSVSVTQGRHDSGRWGELLAAHGTVRLLGIGGSENGRATCKN